MAENIAENITVFCHNSIRIKTGKEGDGIRNIYIDPFRMKTAPKDADVILITHDHFDHFSPEDIEKVAGDHVTLVVPVKMQDKAKEAAKFISRIITVEAGKSYELGGQEDGLEFETVPAYNLLKPFHPKSAGWVGYILKVDGRRIYIAGDTDATKEVKAVKCDVALVPIGGTYTMDAKKAAELVNEMQPSVAIPVHYGSVAGSPEDGKIFEANVKEPVHVEIKIP